MTESSGGVAAVDPDETERHGSVGRLMANVEAKIVDPETGEVLPPAHQGELWLRGPTIMKGDVCLCLISILSIYMIMVMHIIHFNHIYGERRLLFTKGIYIF